MLIIDEKFNGEFLSGTYIALGSFDGIHLGHLSLIHKANELSREHNAKSMIFSFKNHPKTFINPKFAPKLIMDNDEKFEILKEIGVDIACFINFDKKFMMLSPQNFIKELLVKYNIKGIVVGFNYKFGHKNSGNVNDLKALSLKYGFKLYVMDAYKYCGEIISSTKVREAIQSGDVLKANKMLSRPFMLKGIVEKGRQIGRTMGFPTANLKIDERFIIPKIGVYYTNVVWNNKVYKSITSVGTNPTVNGQKLTIETYILDFSENIYDHELKLFFLEKIREQEKFDSLDALKNRLQEYKNIAKARKIEIKV